jgi:aminopeptidase-like protein
MIDNAVKQMIMSRCEASKNNDDFEKHKARIESYKIWKQKHVLCPPGSTIKAGDKLDVRDTEYIWCIGFVELKISTLDRPPLLYIHYDGWNRKFDEYMFITSDRLAPFGTYTSRNDIPRYSMNNY